MNIYMSGVGGQGIGLLSAVLLRALDKAGMQVKGVDTHGLAQRGGVVVSQIRTGKGIYSPLIQPGQADLVLSLERHEALRAADSFLKDAGDLAYYDTVWQPYAVRNRSVPEVSVDFLNKMCKLRNIRVFRVSIDDLPDSRMQNTAVLKMVLEEKLIPGLERKHMTEAMEDLLSGKSLEENLKILNS